MNKIKKALSVLAVSGMAFASILGCSGSGGSSSSGDILDAEEAAQDTTPITIQYWHSHAEAQLEGLDYMLAEFHKKYPHITVEPVFQGAYVDLHKKLQAAVAAKEVPAVTNVEVSVLPNFADSGVFADLTPYIERDQVDLNDFSQGMLQAYAYNGKQYGLPLIVSTSVFIYNKTLLDELGVEPPQTWDDIEAYNQKVALKEGGQTTRYAFSVPGWDTWYYDPWISNGGGSILNEDMTASTLDQPDSLRWIQNFYKWLQDGSLHMGFGKGASGDMRTMFLEGKIAMVQHTSAVIKTYLESANFEVGVSFIPGDKERKSHIGGAGIVLMEGADAREKEAGWKFIEFMTSAEHNINWAEKVGYLPTRKSAIESEEGKQYFERQPQYRTVFEHFDDVAPRLQHPAYPEFSEKYKEVVGEMILNGKDPTSLMPEAVKQINDILSDY
ncbi:ABC transporter substrate-binding protein [Paenibacillus sp. 32O-W]|uniref:ABC transporter substrate-binding protein n=2 Tax=Paenibacillus TaxID=44249 RepID=A0ABQ4N0L9_9BACL|nr:MULTISPECIES: ABC transporter substrate-binding protein [Paenibacillus]ALS29926.1 ABC transporter substrate-binding protein [Paenibacillus sp. 32O-W]GIQ61668.1 ABC transporter substrate-binding protein [Paenibacillus cisolokensis]